MGERRQGTVLGRQGTVLCLLFTKRRQRTVPCLPRTVPCLLSPFLRLEFRDGPNDHIFTHFTGKQRLEFFTERSYNKNGLQNQLYRARFHFRILPGDVNVPA